MKLLVLGAGIYQVPLIKTAQKMGVYTIVTSIPGNYPGFSLADKVYFENTVDADAILEIAKNENIDGIVTTGTDVAIPTLGKVCDAMGLKGLSFEAANLSSNKRLMKEAYEKFGVRTAKFREISVDDLDYVDKLSGLEFPLIFKAVDSSGSRGITRVDSYDEFETARKCVLDNTKSDYFLVEEFIEGEEFGAQAFVQDGKVEFILPHGDYIYTGNTGVPIGHYAPYDLPDSVIADCKETLEAAIKAMKLDNCAINADFILKDGKTYVLEIGGRSGATCLAELVSIYYGFNYFEKIVQVALGEHADFSSNEKNPNASHLLMAKQDGVISQQINKNLSSPNLVEVQFDFEVGDEVKKFEIGPHRIGHVITRGKTLAEAEAELEKALANISIQSS